MYTWTILCPTMPNILLIQTCHGGYGFNGYGYRYDSIRKNCIRTHTQDTCIHQPTGYTIPVLNTTHGHINACLPPLSLPQCHIDTSTCIFTTAALFLVTVTHSSFKFYCDHHLMIFFFLSFSVFTVCISYLNWNLFFPSFFSFLLSFRAFRITWNFFFFSLFPLLAQIWAHFLLV